MPASRSRSRSRARQPSDSAATRRPRTRKIPTPAPDEPSTPVSDLTAKTDPRGPSVLQLFDERPHPALPAGTLARYPISDLSEEAISAIAERVLAGLPAALAKARMQP